MLTSSAGTLIWATTVADVSTLAHTLQTPTSPAGGVGASPVCTTLQPCYREPCPPRGPGRFQVHFIISGGLP